MDESIDESYKSWTLRPLSVFPVFFSAGNWTFLGGTEAGRCSELLAGLLQNLDEIQLLFPSGSPQRTVMELLPAIAGRMNPHQEELLTWGCDLHISTAPMGKLP